MTGYSHGINRTLIISVLFLLPTLLLAMDPPERQDRASGSPPDIITVDNMATFIGKAFELSAHNPILVVFDIDNVLLHCVPTTVSSITSGACPDDKDDSHLLPGPMLSSIAAMSVSEGASLMVGTGASPQYFLAKQPKQHAISGELTKWINELTQIADVICLTSRDSVKPAELVHHGLRLLSSHNAIELETLENEKIQKHPHCNYQNNIIYTGFEPKGPPLLTFCEFSATAYHTVLFIDDDLKKVQSVVDTLHAAGIHVLGYHLTGKRVGMCSWKSPAQSSFKEEPFFHAEPED